MYPDIQHLQRLSPRAFQYLVNSCYRSKELEAIRLSDFEGLDQEAAANLMEVSRQTYGRILAHARSIVSEALVTGKALRIEGGDYEFRGRGRRRHRGGLTGVKAKATAAV